jgi:hypothetical protein
MARVIIRPRKNIKSVVRDCALAVETGHNCRDFASEEAVSAALSAAPVKKGNRPKPIPF